MQDAVRSKFHVPTLDRVHTTLVLCKNILTELKSPQVCGFCILGQFYKQLLAQHFHFCLQYESEITMYSNYSQLFKKNPLNRSGSGKGYGGIEVKGEPNTALLSTILVLGTFFIAFYMRKIRTSHFLGRRVCMRLCFFFLAPNPQLAYRLIQVTAIRSLLKFLLMLTLQGQRKNL